MTDSIPAEPRERRRNFKLRRFPPVQLLLYGVLRTVLMVVGMFPSSMAPRVGRSIGRILRRLDRKHRLIAEKNIRNSRGICAPEDLDAFLDRVYGHMGLSFVEMLMTPRLLRNLDRNVRLERFHVVEPALRLGKGLITVIGHQGNWELVGLAVCKAGHPLHSLARPIENPWIDRFLTEFRTQTGQRIISKYRALGEMIRVLQKNQILIVQIDQDARHHGVFVDFFGRPAATHRSPATLALKYGTPIVVADIHRRDGVHYCVLSDPIHPEAYRDRVDPVRELTQAYTSRFEDCVRAHPEQWFWVHDRWKTAERAALRAMDPAGAGMRSA